MRHLLSSALEPILPFLSTGFDKVTKCKFLVLAGMPVKPTTRVSTHARDTHTLPPPPEDFRGFSHSHMVLSHSLMVISQEGRNPAPALLVSRGNCEEGAADLPKTTAEPPRVPTRPLSLHAGLDPYRHGSWNLWRGV